jgi:DNA repair exonuclease SbcCD nuclease subunit
VTRLVKDSPFTDRLIAHLGLDGCDLGADFVYKNEGDWNLEKLHADRFDMGFFGHFHKHQKIRDNFYYVGAPMHHNFGDSGQPRGCLLDRGGKLSFIELDFPRFANCEHNDLPTINSRDFYRLNVDENIDTTKYELDNVDIVRVKKEQNAVSKPMTFMEAIESYIAEIDDASIDKAVLFKYVNTFIE